MKKIQYAIALSVALIVAKTQAQTGKSFPTGEIKGPFEWKSAIYPGTERNFWIYLPQQYDAATPACTMIVQDGLSRATGWNLPRVLDSLISLKEIPVIIGIFVDHGKVPAAGIDNFPRFNRSFEYDALGDRYARFLLEEILPEVAKSYNLSKDPNDRSIAGASSGAICAFNAAWERPDQFRRVLSTIGTYVGLRGGDAFPTLVRKTEPKALRVFLEDGDHDLNIYGGDWWMANQAMLSALTWAGYEVNHTWGHEGHNSKGALSILPEALKWLWKDYPQAIKTHPGPVPRFNPTLEGEPWKEVITPGQKPIALAINKKGEVYFTSSNGIFRLESNSDPTLFSNKVAAGISFSPDGNLYAISTAEKKLIAFDEKGHPQDILLKISGVYPSTCVKGVYFSDPDKDHVGFYSFSTKRVVYTKVPSHPTGLSLNAEQTFLNVSVNQALGHSLKINEGGTLSTGQDYIHYHVPYGKATPAPSGMTVDSENMLYTATNMGIQISDQLGRVNYILPVPSPNITDVKFGGPDFNILYVCADGKLLGRKLSTKGVLSFLPPAKPSRPGL